MQDRLDSLKIIDALKEKFQAIRTKRGVLRDLALQRFHDFVNSESVQRLLERVPFGLKQRVRDFVKRVENHAKKAGEFR